MTNQLSHPIKNGRFLLGCCFGLFGLLFGLFWENLFHLMINKSVVLRPNSKIFDIWKSPPLTVVFDFYLFNWTNPGDFDNPLIKPMLKELGPYRFYELPNKENIVWHQHNASVSYHKRSRYYFDEQASAGRLTDYIFTVNSLAATAAAKAKRFSPMRRTVIDMALSLYENDEILIKKSVDELLFTGFEDVLVDMLNVIPTTLSNIMMPFDRIGYVYGRNNSDFYGEFNVHTGVDDASKAGVLHSWNQETSTKFFPSQCAKITGSAGEFQTPNLKPGKTILFYSPDLCRPVELEFDGTTEIFDVTGYRYFGGPLAVDNGTLRPENSCYCNGECVLSGAMNVSSCWFDSPLFVSYPHFLHADPYYLDQVIGLQPAQDKHELYVVLEPNTGFALEFAARFQVNILIEPLPYLSMFKDKRKIFFPLFWFEQRVKITPDLAAELSVLSIVYKFGYLIAVFSLLAGLILMLWQPMRNYCDQRLEQQICISELENNSTTTINEYKNCN